MGFLNWLFRKEIKGENKYLGEGTLADEKKEKQKIKLYTKYKKKEMEKYKQNFLNIIDSIIKKFKERKNQPFELYKEEDLDKTDSAAIFFSDIFYASFNNIEQRMIFKNIKDDFEEYKNIKKEYEEKLKKKKESYFEIEPFKEEQVDTGFMDAMKEISEHLNILKEEDKMKWEKKKEKIEEFKKKKEGDNNDDFE